VCLVSFTIVVSCTHTHTHTHAECRRRRTQPQAPFVVLYTPTKRRGNVRWIGCQRSKQTRLGHESILIPENGNLSFFTKHTMTAAPTTSSSSLQCKANCVVLSSGQQLSATVAVLGTLSLTQQHAAAVAVVGGKNSASVVRITGTLHNLSPGTHGLCLCAAGDLSKGASSCGPIFNPFGTSSTKCVSNIDTLLLSSGGWRPTTIAARGRFLSNIWTLFPQYVSPFL
jgi:hypothetical protein